LRAKLTAVALALALASGGCIFGDEAGDASGELRELATQSLAATYRATYRFDVTGPLAPAVTTVLKIAQAPPRSVRQLRTTTPGADGKPVTVEQWQAQGPGGTYSCTRYDDIGVRCLKNPLLSATFGSVRVDEFFDLPRGEGAFTSVKHVGGSPRIAGIKAECFTGVPQPPTAPPVRSPQPRFTPERFSFELCYTPDGVLLRGRKTITGPVPTNVEGRRSMSVEALTVSSNVKPADTRLPGPVVRPEDVSSAGVSGG
jgi:hypothetical protein